MTDGPSPLTHLDSRGRPRMVDVSETPETHRTAVARGWIRMDAATLEAVLSGEAPKGSVLAAGELAGIMAGKRTGELIPLCHILPAVGIGVALTPDRELPGIRAEATARIAGSTGVEMEALMAVSVALLTIYDMTKALDRGMRIEGIELVSKEGGRTGPWTAGQRPQGEPSSGA
jgi:cyclic pyranopterin monophosphate synthase